MANVLHVNYNLSVIKVFNLTQLVESASAKSPISI